MMQLYKDDPSRWKACSTRDPLADGHFITCVRTTKIYCRPTCKARPPRRENVSFVDTIEEAERAGYRACKRCKPNVSGLMPQEKAVRMVKDFIQHHEAMTTKTTTPALSDGASEPETPAPTEMNLREMAAATNLSKWHFHRVFKQVTGMTPREWMKSRTQSPVLTTDSVETPSSIPDLLFQDPFFFDLGQDDFGAGYPPLPPDNLDSWPPIATENAEYFPKQVEDVVLTDSSDQDWTVFYATRNLARGRLLLVLFHQQQVALVHQASDSSEFVDVLDKQFPKSFFSRVALEVGSPAVADMNKRADELAKLLELPV